MNEGDAGIWCSLGKYVFLAIPLVIFIGSLLRGSSDQVHGPGPMVGSVDRGSVFSGHPKTWIHLGIYVTHKVLFRASHAWY